MMRAKVMGIAAILALGSACGVGPGAGDSVSLDECAGNADVDDATEIVWLFEDSVHELITCGQLTIRFVDAVIVSAAVLIGDPSSAPDGLSYADGMYTSVGTGLRMDLTPTYGPSTPGGASGQPLGVDLFAADSWLVNPSATAQGDDYVVTFDAPGPLAPLLGLGDAPTSPVTITPAVLQTATENLGTIDLVATIDVDETRGSSQFTWHVKDGGGFIGDMFGGRQMDLSKIDGASGAREDLGQAMETTTWDVTYADGTQPVLDGTIAVSITGGPFDFVATYTYLPIDPDPSIEVTCP